MVPLQGLLKHQGRRRLDSALFVDMWHLVRICDVLVREHYSRKYHGHAPVHMQIETQSHI